MISAFPLFAKSWREMEKRKLNVDGGELLLRGVEYVEDAVPRSVPSPSSTP